VTEHRDLSVVAGWGVAERTLVVKEVGCAIRSTADMLERLGDTTEATLRKGDESNQRARLLGEGLVRAATVARRSADEAIGTAMKSMDLCRTIENMEHEARKERERQPKQRGDEDPVPAPWREETSDACDVEKEARAAEDLPKETLPAPGQVVEHEDQLKSAALRLKKRHVALRVKNLRFFSNLNEEALKLQGRLRMLLSRGEGTLLPKVSFEQKKAVFELATQLLDASLSEAASLLEKKSVMTFNRILEKSLSFALALEHATVLAVSADARTQALKLAALVDKELLCYLLDGPFMKRLTAVGVNKRRPDGSLPQSVRRSQSVGPPSAQRWDELASACCRRVVQGVKLFAGLAGDPAELAETEAPES